MQLRAAGKESFIFQNTKFRINKWFFSVFLRKQILSLYLPSWRVVLWLFKLWKRLRNLGFFESAVRECDVPSPRRPRLKWVDQKPSKRLKPPSAGRHGPSGPWMAGGSGRHKNLTGEPTSSVGGLHYAAATGARKFRRQIRPNHGAGSVDAPLCRFWNVHVTCVFSYIPMQHSFVPMYLYIDSARKPE